MSMTAVVLTAALSGSVLSAEEVTHFPGGYFDTRVREPFQRRVMASWPGPTELMRLWRDTELSEEQRVALLLGGAVFHDPAMLPAYREALESDSQLLRQAAIYGYRDLIADRLLDVAIEINEEIVKGLAGEMRWVEHTLRRYSALEMWLQSALVQEGASLPGYNGVRLMRSPSDCFMAAEKLVGVEDLDLLVTAFEVAEHGSSRGALIRLIEGITLGRYIIMPANEKAGWGRHVYDSAYQKLTSDIQQWRRDGCTVDGETVLRGNLRSLGLEIADPLGPEACGRKLWTAILRQDVPQWWMLAARRLYACGGPWYELSALRSDTAQNRARRDRLREWYKPRQTRHQPPGH
jgi:hypothetical protein